MNMTLYDRHRQNQARAKRRSVALNLVSLMDIFTILVFFLLVNSSSVQQPSGGKTLKLPQARVEQAPSESLVVMVNDKEIIVQGRRIVTLAEIEGEQDLFIKPLYEELSHQASRSLPGTGADGVGREVTIMADQELSYKLLKRLMATCAQASYTTLSLAVTRKTKG
ncbi:MAG TPA: biopolymer transporter ExbD [Gammaproteobacteria bacterium]